MKLKMRQLIPNQYCLKNCQRALPSIGKRFCLACSSSIVGSGMRVKHLTLNNNSGKNSAPVAAGIQSSGTFSVSISHLPTLRTSPDANINVTLKIAPRISLVFLPSRKLKTSPQIMPSERPLKNSQIMFNSIGVIANKTSDISAAAIRPIIVKPRC